MTDETPGRATSGPDDIGRASLRDAALARLRACGERVTPGRRAVIDVLIAQPGHVDAETVAALVDDVEPGIHRATIYRSLQALVEVGLVTHTHVPGAATIYHLAPVQPGDAGAERRSGRAGDGESGAAGRGSGLHDHVHLQCVRCGEFTDVDAAEFEPLVARLRELTGFDVDVTHGALLGVCERCKEAGA